MKFYLTYFKLTKTRELNINFENQLEFFDWLSTGSIYDSIADMESRWGTMEYVNEGDTIYFKLNDIPFGIDLNTCLNEWELLFILNKKIL